MRTLINIMGVIDKGVINNAPTKNGRTDIPACSSMVE